MHFQPYDLTYAALEASIIIAVKDQIPSQNLRLAAYRLLESWPMLSYRLNRAVNTTPNFNNNTTRRLTVIAQHTIAKEIPTSRIDDGFFSLSTVKDCASLGPNVVNGVHIYDSTVLAGLFRRQKKKWANIFYPRIFTIQALSTPNGTVLKFTMQHVASDVLGMS